MSVCVASIADSGRSIVVATDQMASMQSASADHAMVKGDFIGLWFAMWSADDITPIPDIVRRATASLEAGPRHKRDWTAHDVASALGNAYRAETLDRAVAEYLSPYGLDMPAFLSNGHHIFDNDYPTKRMEIESFELGIEFLVAGFDQITPSVFTVGRRGHIRYYNKPGFWAIGSGDALAFGALALRRHNSTKTTEETLYAVLEAKFSAELARGVGQHTTAGVLTHHTFVHMMLKDSIAQFRQIWEQEGRLPIPPEALLFLHGWWMPQKDREAKAQQEQIEQMLHALDQPSQVTQPTPKPPTHGRKSRKPSQA